MTEVQTMQALPDYAVSTLERRPTQNRAGAPYSASTLYFIVLGFLTGLGLLAVRSAYLFFS